MATYDTVDANHALDLTPSTRAASFPTQQPEHQQQTAGYQESMTADEDQQQQAGDFINEPLKQLLLTDMEAFFRSEVAPRSAAINEDVANLQYEAGQLADKAEAEKCGVLTELNRLHKLVASFQAQISEALGMMN